MSQIIAIRGILFAVVVFLLPAAALAHTGIGSTSGFGHGFIHPLSGLDHILAMMAVGVIAANFGGRTLWALPLTFMSAMALGGSLGVAGVKLPYVETMIALSVVIFGIVVAIPRKCPVAVAMLMVGVFAVFHGHSHGTEMEETLKAGEYGAGFVTATGLLHLVGIGLARLRPRPLQPAIRIAGIAIATIGLGLLSSQM